MPHIARFSTEFAAREAAKLLHDRGIRATVLCRIGSMRTDSPVDVMVDAADTAAARAILDQAARDPARPEEGWEDHAARPDLSKLPAALAPTCPNCRATLPLDAATDHCPACHATTDIPALIAAAHGPEALEPCYPIVPNASPAPRIAGIWDMLCPTCRYDLRGLPDHGLCPECGHPYDRAQFIRGMFTDEA